MNPDKRAGALAADLASGRYAHVVLDFDHTLFLDNSTDRFLDAMRPRLLAFLLVACTDWLLRALAWFGAVRYNAQRDFVRVLACSVLMPWNLLLWRRQAARLAGVSMNRALLGALGPEQNVIVLSYGFGHVIRPLLNAAGLEKAVLIASSVFPPMKNLRTGGKPDALEQVLPRDAWDRALFVTDSEEDAPIYEAIPRSYLVQWRTQAPPAFTGYYLPFRYTVEAKYPDSRYFTRQIVLEDFALLLLAYAFSWQYAGALACLFVSLYAIYEIGYYDNDHVAPAYEEKPVVSEAAKRYPAFPRIRPWLWAAGMAALGVGLARPEYLLHPWNLKWAFALEYGCWMALLAGVYLVFRTFNRRPPHKRLLLFPMLHVLKTFSFAMLVPLTILGALLLAGQVLSISMNYFIYRHGGDWQRFNRQAARMAVFLPPAALVWLALPAGSLGAGPARWTLILAWGAMRSLEQARRKNILRIAAELFQRKDA